ncbi:MAG TPA: IS200/IS605 family transposase [Ignavibacteriaceae bacterium]|nr:IS200/IS605 family transposase [Ignavibacteriaceae bacterium]
MSHSSSKIWLHLIFGTRNRQPYIYEELERELYKFIIDKLENEFSCKVKAANGTKDHLHLLILFNPQYVLTDIIKAIKGSSSNWINNNQFFRGKFYWQKGYSVYSVSESIASSVYKYIMNQKEHHKKVSFQEEYNSFLDVHKLEILD